MLQFSHKVKYITQVLFYPRFIVLRVVYAVTDVVYWSVMLYMSLFLFSVAARTQSYLFKHRPIYPYERPSQAIKVNIGDSE